MPSRTFSTADTYTSAAQLRSSPPRKGITIVVTNASVYAAFAVADLGQRHAAAFDFNVGDERIMIPGVWNWSGDDFGDTFLLAGVELRSAVAGASAVVTVHY